MKLLRLNGTPTVVDLDKFVSASLILNPDSLGITYNMNFETKSSNYALTMGGTKEELLKVYNCLLLAGGISTTDAIQDFYSTFDDLEARAWALSESRKQQTELKLDENDGK